MELKFELALIKDLIEKKIHPEKIVTNDVMEAFFEEVKTVFVHEVERIENQLREAMMNIESETQKKEYVLHHQVNTVRLADKVYDYLMPKDRNGLYQLTVATTADNMYKQIFICLEGLLQFMENDFPDHFDKRVKVPEAYRWLLENDVREKITTLKRELKETGVEEGLTEVACMPLADLLVSEREISYSTYQFLKTLFKKLSSFPHLHTINNATERFLRMLWRINYNSVWLYNYSVVEYDRTVKASSTSNEAIHYLQLEEKMLKQVAVRTDVAFRQQQPAIITLLLGWISEELKLLKEEQAETKLLKKWGKIVTILSVEELGYGCRLLHNKGLFPEIEESELLEIAAASFITPKSKDISADSIKNKSGKPGAKSKERVKGYLYEMARMVR